MLTPIFRQIGKLLLWTVHDNTLFIGAWLACAPSLVRELNYSINTTWGPILFVPFQISLENKYF